MVGAGGPVVVARLVRGRASNCWHVHAEVYLLRESPLCSCIPLRIRQQRSFYCGSGFGNNFGISVRPRRTDKD
ncbi:hypothetical protein NDU88_001344 [Pleurodeles waltl]|uniref:Secreted protein n=1 Tax=Pleurodeles waltl TaxID=8319 RepID=A0AAV7NEW3_PLEWA|nr:hypothetical protein NDU88_001344 [Pleurodeles waltl]